MSNNNELVILNKGELNEGMCDTCGLKERNMTTWYFTPECTDCNIITRQKDFENLKNKPRVVKRRIVYNCVMCNIRLERDKDGVLLCVYEYKDNKHYCKTCYFSK